MKTPLPHKRLYRGRVVTAFMAIVLIFFSGKAVAAQAPSSLEKLREKATHIVTGEITGIESRPRLSRIEKGGTDYVIHCHIAVESVEKGEHVKPGDQLVVSCFRPRSRLGFWQSMSLQGHSPVPAVGQKVRAHLLERPGEYHVIHPNGFTSIDGGSLIGARRIEHPPRWSPLFTFLLPLELWALILVVVLPAAVVGTITRSPDLRKDVKLILALPAGLFAVGLVLGFLEYFTAADFHFSWSMPAGVGLLGISALAFGALSVWLCVTGLRSTARFPSL